jgi:hypothetical protein
MVNGFVYWIHANEPYIFVLNTATLEFSRLQLPLQLSQTMEPSSAGWDLIFRIGETKDGELCIVCTINSHLLLWVLEARHDGTAKTWTFRRSFSLDPIVELTDGSIHEEYGELKIVAIISGYVYFSTNVTLADRLYPCWFLSLCMETAHMDTLFQKRFDCNIYPYIMAWPPSMVQNSQLEKASVDKVS